MVVAHALGCVWDYSSGWSRPDAALNLGMDAMIRFLPMRRVLHSALLVISTVLVVAAAAGTAAGSGVGASVAAQSGPALNPRHPERYVVKRGDTLWDISGMFLRDPWFWPEIWYVNPQVRNPHLIYPGDVLTLVYVDGQPQIRLERGAQSSGSGKLSPRIREEDLPEAIDTIPFEVIGAFLSKGAVLTEDEVNQLPYILAIRDGHLTGAAGNDVYVRGNVAGEGGYSVVHIGEQLVDPDDETVVGYEGIFVGEGTLRRTGDPATLRLTRTNREALEGDRLLTLEFNVPLNFYPRAPKQDIQGSIIHVVDGMSRIGQYQVVVLNRGDRDGLEPGHVLTVMRRGVEVEDRGGNREYREFTSRRNQSKGLFGEKVQLPDEQAGTVMVFKTYERISYALVMEADEAIKILDGVVNPI